METTRRSFLKIVAAVGAASVAPLRLIAEDAPLLSGDRLLALLRETTQYDLARDITIVRHDVLYAMNDIINQVGCDQMLPDNHEGLEQARSSAVVILRDYLQSNGISEDDIYAVPEFKVGTMLKVRRPDRAVG